MLYYGDIWIVRMILLGRLFEYLGGGLYSSG